MKKLEGLLKHPSVLGMVLAPKFSGGRAPSYVDIDVVANMVVVGKREEACAIIAQQKLALLPNPEVWKCTELASGAD